MHSTDIVTIATNVVRLMVRQILAVDLNLPKCQISHNCGNTVQKIQSDYNKQIFPVAGRKAESSRTHRVCFDVDAREAI